MHFFLGPNPVRSAIAAKNLRRRTVVGNRHYHLQFPISLEHPHSFKSSRTFLNVDPILLLFFEPSNSFSPDLIVFYSPHSGSVICNSSSSFILCGYDGSVGTDRRLKCKLVHVNTSSGTNRNYSIVSIDL